MFNGMKEFRTALGAWEKVIWFFLFFLFCLSLFRMAFLGGRVYPRVIHSAFGILALDRYPSGLGSGAPVVSDDPMINTLFYNISVDLLHE